jgi:hypothetical protein
MKWLSLILLLLSCLTTVAQDNYKKLLTPGKVWKCQVVDDYGSAVVKTPYTITVEGDTIFMGRNCKKLSVVYDESQKPMFFYDVIAYEENKKVYVYKYEFAASDDDWTLMLNFSLHKGNVATDYGEYTLNEDSVEVNGTIYRRLTSGDLCWIEGIGSASNLWASDISRPTHMETKEMLACYENGKLLFSKDDFTKKAYKRDETRIECVMAHKGSEDETYNITGQRVKAVRKGEIFIQNGIKRIVK